MNGISDYAGMIVSTDNSKLRPITKDAEHYISDVASGMTLLVIGLLSWFCPILLVIGLVCSLCYRTKFCGLLSDAQTLKVIGLSLILIGVTL